MLDFKKADWRSPACALLAFIFARCSLFQDIYPFSAALLCVFFADKRFLWLLPGILLGRLSTVHSLAELLLTTLPLVPLLPCLYLFKIKKIERLIWRQAATAASFILCAFFINALTYERIMLVLTGLCACALEGIGARVYSTLTQLRDRLCLDRADLISLLTLACITVSSAASVSIWLFNPYFILVCLLAGFSARVLSFSGCACGMALALLYILNGGDTTVALSICICASISAVLSPWKIGPTMGFLLGDLLISTFFLHDFSFSLGLPNILLGTIPLCFIGKNALLRLRRLAGRISGVNDRQADYIARIKREQTRRLKSAASMYAELSRVFAYASRTPEYKEKIAASAKQTCDNCEKNAYCWTSRKTDTLNEFFEAAESLISTETLSALPPTLAARCRRNNDLLASFHQSFRALESLPSENRQNVIQLKSISDMLFSIADSVNELPDFDHAREASVRDMLSGRIRGIEDIACQTRGESIVIDILLQNISAKTGDEICALLRDGFKTSYTCNGFSRLKNGEYSGRFTSAPAYRIESCARRKNKNGENVCGDSFALREIDGGKYLAAISDGAGSGKSAARESEGALDILEALTCSDVRIDETFDAINRLLLLRGKNDGYSTIDAAEFDLERGELNWTKLGAVPGYIIRAGRVERVDACSLPVGILENVRPATIKKLIQHNDIIVLISDGIYDGLCTRDHDGVYGVLTQKKTASPQEIADALILSAQESKHDDDMTVVVLKVEAA